MVLYVDYMTQPPTDSAAPISTADHVDSDRVVIIASLYCSNAKTSFQSSLTLMTIQPFFFAWS